MIREISKKKKQSLECQLDQNKEEVTWKKVYTYIQNNIQLPFIDPYWHIFFFQSKFVYEATLSFGKNDAYYEQSLPRDRSKFGNDKNVIRVSTLENMRSLMPYTPNFYKNKYFVYK